MTNMLLAFAWQSAEAEQLWVDLVQEINCWQAYGYIVEIYGDEIVIIMANAAPPSGPQTGE